MENTNEYERLKLNVHLIANYTVDDEGITDSTIEECYEYIKEKDVLSLDIETTRKYNKYEREGLDPHTTNIVMLQIGDDKKQFVIDVRDIDITFLKPILEGKSVKVGHNLKFEYKHLLNYGIKLKNLYDTYIAEEVIYKGFFQRNSLEFLNIRYLNKQVNKDTRMEFLSIRDRPFTIDQIKYGAEDVLHPMLIKEMQEVRIEKEKLSRAIELEMLYIPVLGDMEYNGLHIDTEKWLKLYDSNLKKFEDTQRELDEYVINNHFDTQFVDKQYDMFSQGFTCRISWTSSKQVVEFLRYLNICPKEVSATTKKLTYTAETKVLRAHIAKIKDEVPEDVQNFVKTYFKLKNYEQYTTTFGDKYLRHVNPITGRLHSNFRQVLNTGRISSSNPNLQNIPSGKDFRSCLTAPEGKKLINADYSGQENICLVNASLDENLLAFYASGESDMHKYNCV